MENTAGAAKALQDFFAVRIAYSFNPIIELRDGEIQAYVAGVLADFAASSMMWKICDDHARPLKEAAEFLAEADPVGGRASSFDREWMVRKHLGDYTLFILGMFPRGAKNFHRLPPVRAIGDANDLAALGKESYRVAASFDMFEYSTIAPLLRKMERHFELCVEGLHGVAKEVRLQ
jgi:hypothetical protein